MTMIADVVTCFAMALVLAPLGWWGTRNAHDLVPTHLPEHHRQRRERVLRRGGVTAQGVAVLFVLMGVLRALV